MPSRVSTGQGDLRAGGQGREASEGDGVQVQPKQGPHGSNPALRYPQQLAKGCALASGAPARPSTLAAHPHYATTAAQQVTIPKGQFEGEGEEGG